MKLQALVNAEESDTVKVSVKAQTMIGQWHTRFFNGPGYRLAIDSNGKKYPVFYSDKCDEIFEAVLYKIGDLPPPIPFAQNYAVVISENKPLAA